jgi:membrane fusion protein, multidrug efflux system
MRRVAVTIALAGLLTGCSRDTKRAPAAEVPVVVARVETRDVPEQIEAVATVEPLETVSVTAQATGRIVTVAFKEGQDVRAGALLFEIDPGPYEVALAQSRGARARDEAQAQNAAVEAHRADELAAQGLLSQEQHDQASSAAASQKGLVAADTAAVRGAELDLAYTKIRAPISGRTGSVLLHLGNVVKPADGKPLVVINRIDPIFVAFSVPEQRLAAIRAAQSGHGLDVVALIAGDPEPVSEGRLTFIDNQVDRESGTIRLKATFANGKGRLWPGQFVNVRMTLGIRAGVLLVPEAAVQPGQQGSYVYVVKADKTVEQRTVSTEPADPGNVIVTKGLKADETVVVDGQLRLTKDAHIQVKPAVAAPAKESPAPGGGQP